MKNVPMTEKMLTDRLRELGAMACAHRIKYWRDNEVVDILSAEKMDVDGETVYLVQVRENAMFLSLSPGSGIRRRVIERWAIISPPDKVRMRHLEHERWAGVNAHVGSENREKLLERFLNPKARWMKKAEVEKLQRAQRAKEKRQ